MLNAGERMRNIVTVHPFQDNESAVDSGKHLVDFESGSGVSDTCKQVVDVANEKRKASSDPKITDKSHDLYGKLIESVQKFLRVGDLVAQVDPIHVGLPWAGIRFMLQVRV